MIIADFGDRILLMMVYELMNLVAVSSCGSYTAMIGRNVNMLLKVEFIRTEFCECLLSYVTASSSTERLLCCVCSANHTR